MIKRINCAQELDTFLDTIEKDFSEFVQDYREECVDEWTTDYAICLLTLAEDDYRDYDAIETDIIKTLYQQLGIRVPIFRPGESYDCPGYVIEVRRLNDLLLEIELYKKQ